MHIRGETESHREPERAITTNASSTEKNIPDRISRYLYFRSHLFGRRLTLSDAGHLLESRSTDRIIIVAHTIGVILVDAFTTAMTRNSVSTGGICNAILAMLIHIFKYDALKFLKNIDTRRKVYNCDQINQSMKMSTNQPITKTNQPNHSGVCSQRIKCKISA